MEARRIGLLMDFFRAGVGEGAAAYARANGLQIDPRWSIRADWMSSRPEWQGVIAHIVDLPDAERRIAGLGLPTVLLGPFRHSETPAFPQVLPDYEKAGRLAFEELDSMGLEQVVHLQLSRNSPIDALAHAGFTAASRSDDPPLPGYEHWDDDLSRWVGPLADQVASLARPAGIFVVHAGVAYSLQIELLARGLRIPEDIAMICLGKDPQDTAAMAPVPITTVDVDHWQQGYFATSLLHRHFEGAPLEASQHRIAPSGVTRRDSTGVAVVRDPIIAKVLHHIHRHFAGDLRVDRLAQAAGVSRRSLEERFRKVTGRSVHEAVVRERIENARKRIRSGDDPLAAIAHECGFSSVHYFTTAFRRRTGVTPGEYRKRCRDQG